MHPEKSFPCSLSYPKSVPLCRGTICRARGESPEPPSGFSSLRLHLSGLSGLPFLECGDLFTLNIRCEGSPLYGRNQSTN